MTVNIKPPQEVWVLSADTYMYRGGAQTRPNVKPQNYPVEKPRPLPVLQEVTGTRRYPDANTGKLYPSALGGQVFQAKFDRLTGFTKWENLKHGNSAIYYPKHFALSSTHNFSNNTVSFLYREEGIYYLTPDQLKRYLAGERLYINGTKQFISIDEVREPTLFDDLGEEWAV